MSGPSNLHAASSKIANAGSKQKKRPRPTTNTGTSNIAGRLSDEANTDDERISDLASPGTDSKSINVDSPPAALSSSSSNFRNVSACNRCRLRKNRCDQRLPACAACEKAGVKCVGFDPITKKEIPRSYVYFLESRVAYLESLLEENDLKFDPPEGFAQTSVFKSSSNDANNSGREAQAHQNEVPAGNAAKRDVPGEVNEQEKLNNLVSHTSQVAVQGTSDSRYLGSTAGISFARVVFAAVRSSLSGAPSERGGVRASKPLASGSTGTTMRDSFFSLNKKPTFKPAPFPSKALGIKLVDLYFEHANPQIPILHRPEFMSMFDRVYTSDKPTKRELYMLNIVFAIGAGTIVGKEPEKHRGSKGGSPEPSDRDAPGAKRRKLEDDQRPPEEYHASAMEHLGDFLAASSSVDRPFELGGALEELQAVLLLSSFALLRPVAPGLWYIIGVAVRLAVDLGLHQEDLPEAESQAHSRRASSNGSPNKQLPFNGNHLKLSGRRQSARDFRRRLWWCVYSFDRLVSTVVGRPFGITDVVITTNFPSPLDDKFITPAGILSDPDGNSPSYKHISYHYFRLRILQSEIVQVLQHRQAQMLRQKGINQGNPFMHTRLQSPFLKDFGNSFRSWRHDIDRRLLEWKNSAPSQADTGVQFQPLFLELNYWQALIMLYRQSLTVPSVLAEDLKNVKDDVQRPSLINLEEQEDQDQIFLKVAEAGQKALKIYRQLHRMYLVNYTFLATHHLFMAGISFLYAIWHSTLVRSQLTLDDVDFTVLAATSVLDDLIEKCPPAEACRDAFVRMSKATIKMALSTTGFGDAAASFMEAETRSSSRRPRDGGLAERMDVPIDPALTSGFEANKAALRASQNEGNSNRVRSLRFDTDFRDLFGDSARRQRQTGITTSWLQQQAQASAAAQTAQFGLSSKQPGQHSHSRSLSSSLAPMNLNSPPLEHPLALNRSTSAFLSPPNLSRSPGIIASQQPLSILSTSADSARANNGSGQRGDGSYSPYISKVHQQYPGPDRFSDLDFLDSIDFSQDMSGLRSGNGPIDAVNDTTPNLGQSGWDVDFGMNIGMGWDGNLPGLNNYDFGVADAGQDFQPDNLRNIQMTDASPTLGDGSLPATTPSGIPSGSGYMTAHDTGAFSESEGNQGIDLFGGFFFGNGGG